MGLFAIVKNNRVENVVVINQSQIQEFETIYNAEIIDALPYGLDIGDLKVGNNWTRNINGVQTILELITPQQQFDYNNLRSSLQEKTELIEQAEIAFREGVDSIE